MLRRVPAASIARRYLSAEASHVQQATSREKRFVRIAGPASYASREDIELFLKRNGVEKGPSATSETSSYSLQQGQADVFQNHSIWVFDAGSQDAARVASEKISGKVAGLKLVRAAPIDARLVNEMTMLSASKNRRTTLRKRMNVIAPTDEERGRALLASNLPVHMPSRVVWSFFGAYEVCDVRHLRKSGVACIVFATADDAHRAMRERSNLRIQNKNTIVLKMHE